MSKATAMKGKSTKAKGPAKQPAKGPVEKKVSPGTVEAVAMAAADKAETWMLRLYVAGQTPKSLQAFANLKRLCETHLAGRYKIEVIDLMENPQLAVGDQILAVPTLVRKLPSPLKRVIGNLSDEERFLVGLDLKVMN